MRHATKTSATFDPGAFERLREAEGSHFWFCVRRKWIFDKMRKFIPPPADFLEVGCGTGNVCSFLGRKGYRATGCEFYSEALSRAWPGFIKVQGDATALPLPEGSFDAVGFFDVIEHLPDSGKALEAAFRVLRSGGILIVTVPAREELWSWTDEEALHKRRYTSQTLKAELHASDFDVLLLENMFMGLYLPMRLIRKKTAPKKPDLFKIGAATNVAMKGYFHLERMISDVLPLPIGTSLIAIARKR